MVVLRNVLFKKVKRLRRPLDPEELARGEEWGPACLEETDEEEHGKQLTKKERSQKGQAEGTPSPKVDTVAEHKDAQPTVSEEAKADFIQQAIKDILHSIASKDFQGMPKDWHKKYKPTLGAFKKFVSQHPDTFTIHEGRDGNFAVTKLGGKYNPLPEKLKENAKNTKSAKNAKKWKELLHSAWHAYCQATAKHEVSVDTFIGALSQTDAPKRKLMDSNESSNQESNCQKVDSKKTLIPDEAENEKRKGTEDSTKQQKKKKQKA